MKNTLKAVLVALGLSLASPTFATDAGYWHGSGDGQSMQSSEDRCQMEAHSAAYDFVMTLLHDLFHEHEH